MASPNTVKLNKEREALRAKNAPRVVSPQESGPNRAGRRAMITPGVLKPRYDSAPRLSKKEAANKRRRISKMSPRERFEKMRNRQRNNMRRDVSLRMRGKEVKIAPGRFRLSVQPNESSIKGMPFYQPKSRKNRAAKSES